MEDLGTIEDFGLAQNPLSPYGDPLAFAKSAPAPETVPGLRVPGAQPGNILMPKGVGYETTGQSIRRESGAPNPLSPVIQQQGQPQNGLFEELNSLLMARGQGGIQPGTSNSNLPTPSASDFGKFDLASYKQRTAQIESSSGQTSSNIYQFQPGTWARVGGGNLNDPKAQDAAMDRLTAQNLGVLRNGLGREPTPAEVYLAHQQGANGFLKLLQEPGRRAGDIVGDKAISGNGGDPNAPASAFTNMWINKYNGVKETGAPKGPLAGTSVPVGPFAGALQGQNELQQKLWHMMLLRTLFPQFHFQNISYDPWAIHQFGLHGGY